MKPSKFNILTQSKGEDGHYLLYNTLQDHRILFDDPAFNPHYFFEKILKHQPLTDNETRIASELRETGILLEDDVDEQKIFDEWYEKKIRERTDFIHITILPTMACNLACEYCFENKTRQKGMMSPETIQNVIQWTSHRIKQIGPESIHITFFGGEPLLHPQAIKTITKTLWKFCRSHHTEIDFGLITNGVLLSPEFVDELRPFGFRWIKITFDGDREAHDRKRIGHARQKTFDAIYNNLCAIRGKLKIIIGGNFDNDNYKSMFDLVERLRRSPFAADIATIRFKPIMKIHPALASNRAEKIASFCEVCSFNNAQVSGIMALQNKTFEEGLPIPERNDIGPCEYHSRHAITIGPDGSLYKCPGFAGIPRLVAGDVFHDEYNEAGRRQIEMKKWDNDCESCAYLPNCCGGCRMNSLNKTGDLSIKSCEENYLVEATEVFMQRELAVLENDRP